MVGVASVALALFLIPTHAWFDSLGSVIQVNMTSLLAAWASTIAFWVTLTVIGLAVSTFAVIKDAREDEKSRPRLSENDSMN